MNILAGIALTLLAGVMQGAFPLPMKFAAKWNWENIWSLFALSGFVVFPWLLAFCTVPDLLGVYASASGTTLAAMTLFGAGWGLGTICFGIGVHRVGIALGSALIIGAAGALGTLVPMLVLQPDAVATPAGLAIVGGVVLMLVGVGVCAVAGSQKGQGVSREDSSPDRPVETSSFRQGLLICLISGIASPMLNFAFAFSKEIVSKAVAAGASQASASNPIWCWAMTSAFVPTLLYCLYRMHKNRSWNRFVLPGAGPSWGLALLMGILWSGSIAVYGIALSGLGRMDASIGWPVLMMSTIITGNVCGLATGEWKGAGSKARTTMFLGLVVLALAVGVIGLGNR